MVGARPRPDPLHGEKQRAVVVACELLLERTMRSLVCAISFLAVACTGELGGGADDPAANGDRDGGPNASVGARGDGTRDTNVPSADGGPRNRTSDGAADAAGGPNVTPPVDSGPVGVCDPSCTGAKLCDDAQACRCAPGFTASGTDCVAAVVTSPATRSKAEVCARYAADTARPATLWNAGTGGACDPGTVPYDAQVAALRYLNFYRWMIGVGPVQVVPAVASAEQECAKILNYEFGHSPSPTTQCYTANGAMACGGSLIAGGFDLVSQFDGYALETEQNLIHRRNVLAVGRAGVWAGTNGGSSDMHYGGAYPALASDPAYVAHPGPGPNVRSKVPSRWFVQKGTASIPAVDARVTVVSSGEQKPMTRYHHYNDFSSFDLDSWTPAVDVAYRVELVDDSGAVVTLFETTFVDCP